MRFVMGVSFFFCSQSYSRLHFLLFIPLLLFFLLLEEEIDHAIDYKRSKILALERVSLFDRYGFTKVYKGEMRRGGRQGLKNSIHFLFLLI